MTTNVSHSGKDWTKRYVVIGLTATRYSIVSLEIKSAAVFCCGAMVRSAGFDYSEVIDEYNGKTIAKLRG